MTLTTVYIRFSFVGVPVLQLSYSVLTEDVIAVCVCVYGKWEGRNSCSITHIVLSSRAEKAHLPSADFTQKILQKTIRSQEQPPPFSSCVRCHHH